MSAKDELTGIAVAISSVRAVSANGDTSLERAFEVRSVTQREWVSIARVCPDYNFQQSPAYSLEIAKRRGASCEFISVIDAQHGDRVIGVASVRVRSIPIVGGGIAYISAGPLLAQRFTSATDDASLRELLSALVSEYVVNRRLWLRVTLPATDPAVSARMAEACRAVGFRIATTGAVYRSILVDLRRPMEEIRAMLDRKWRNQLTAALRGSIAIDLSTDPHAVARFAPLLEETRHRKGFTIELDATFYDRVQQVAELEERLLVAIAKENDNDIAGVVVSVIGNTAVYVLGATTAASLKSKGAYALHWRVMEAARDAGCHWYDLGGVDPENNPGVYHFKSGFGGSDIVVPGPFEVRPTGFAGLVSRVVDASYARLKRWRS